MIQQRYRTFWKRFLAGCVDAIVLLPIGLLANWLWSHHQHIPNTALALVHLLTNMVGYAYSIYFLGRYGQTLGKMALRLKVLDQSEEQHVTYLQALRRDSVPLAITALLLPYELYQIIAGTYYRFNPDPMPDGGAKVLDLVWMAWFGVEVVTMLFSERRRAVHDFIAGSVVVRQE